MEISPIPYFGLQFALMLFGALLLLIGGALVRNAALEHNAVKADSLLRSESLLWISVGLSALLWTYPFLMRRHRLSLVPYALFVGGGLMFGGCLFFWGWWFGQIPGLSALGPPVAP